MSHMLAVIILQEVGNTDQVETGESGWRLQLGSAKAMLSAGINSVRWVSGPRY